MEHWRVVEQIDDRNSRRFPHQDGFHLANIRPDFAEICEQSYHNKEYAAPGYCTASDVTVTRL